jgi:hypothetical protein
MPKAKEVVEEEVEKEKGTLPFNSIPRDHPLLVRRFYGEQGGGDFRSPDFRVLKPKFVCSVHMDLKSTKPRDGGLNIPSCMKTNPTQQCSYEARKQLRDTLKNHGKHIISGTDLDPTLSSASLNQTERLK